MIEKLQRDRNKKAFVTIKCVKKINKSYITLFNEGSGMVLNKAEGLILTCAHIFEEIDFRKKPLAFVVYGKKKYEADIIVANFIEDIVVLKVNDYDGGFKEEIFLAKRQPKIKSGLYIWSNRCLKKDNENKTCCGKMRIIIGRCFGYDGKYLMYKAETLSGMSGSGVFDNKGGLVGIHARSGDYRTKHKIALAVSLLDIKIFLKRNKIFYKEK